VTSGRRRRCGVLLAGGRGSRFGNEPKGLVPFGDGRLCDPALRALQSCCDEVVVAANDHRAVDWFTGLRVLRDITPHLGALGALHTALHASADATTVVCAWDMPFVTAALLDELAATVDAGAAACVPVHGDGRAEPLVAAYAPICLALADALLARGERSGHALLEAACGDPWPIETRLPAIDAHRIFHNVNTRDDLDRARAWLPSNPA
jgi:molybdopterin-guanine dinucleotide biosynthesis protein A